MAASRELSTGLRGVLGLFFVVFFFFHSEIHLWIFKMASAPLKKVKRTSHTPKLKLMLWRRRVRGGAVTGEEFTMPLKRLEERVLETEPTPDQPKAPPETWLRREEERF